MSDNLKQILLHSFRSGVSDIFLTAGKSPAWRLWGEIKFRYDFPRVTAAELEEFRSSRLDPEREARCQRTGATDAALVLTPELRVRCNFYATASGPAVAIRPIRPASELNFAALNLPDRLSELCLCRRGMILISGATGCGKSTTLAAMIDRINRTRSCHILTLEDPIEYIQSDDLALISQREVSPEIGFAAAIRDAVRENPDVIVIGEMRDLDTVQAAISAALTGHLVIATIHAQDTVQAVERLLNLYPPPLRDQAAADLGLALTAILCQRLIPRADERGMIPAVEILLNTPTVSKAVAARNFGGMEDALRQGAADGMQTFTRAVFQLLRNGRIAQADAKNNVGNPAELELLLKGMDRGVEAFGRQNGDATAADTPAEDMRFLLLAALDNRASDLHLTLDSPPIFRIGGQLRQVEMPPLNGEDIQHLLYSVITSRQRVELEEKRELDFALSVRMRDDGDAVARFRLNAFFQRGALGVVARVIHTEIPSPEELSLPPTLLKLSDKGQGLILVTGPTGSGKSTTLACLLDQINRRRHVKIITIEDPIEYVHTNRRAVVEQRELHSDTKSFASALKSAEIRPAAGSGRDHGRGDAGSGNHFRRAHRRRNRPSRLCDHPHQQCAADGGSDRGFLSQSPTEPDPPAACRSSAGGGLAATAAQGGRGRADRRIRDHDRHSAGAQSDPGKQDLPTAVGDGDRKQGRHGHAGQVHGRPLQPETGAIGKHKSLPTGFPPAGKLLTRPSRRACSTARPTP